MISNTEKLVKLLSSKFFKFETQGLLISLNALTISVETFPPNSVLWVQRKGTGKSHFLKILAQSNSDYFFELPSKVYETSILQLDEDVFKDKVWIHDDLIVLLHGLATKQRQQLMNFFVEFLSSGVYERSDTRWRKRVEGRISCIFPMSQENYSRYGREMFYQTLVPERLIPVGYNFTAEDLKEAGKLVLNRKNENTEIKLPFKKERVHVYVSKEFNDEIVRMASSLQVLVQLSITRGVRYISNLLKAHALLNDRNEVTREDIEIVKLLLPFHTEPREDIESEVRRFVFKRLMENGEVDFGVIYTKFSNYNRKVIERVLRKLRKDCCLKPDGKGFCL